VKKQRNETQQTRAIDGKEKKVKLLCLVFKNDEWGSSYSAKTGDIVSGKASRR